MGSASVTGLRTAKTELVIRSGLIGFCADSPSLESSGEEAGCSTWGDGIP